MIELLYEFGVNISVGMMAMEYRDGENDWYAQAEERDGSEYQIAHVRGSTHAEALDRLRIAVERYRARMVKKVDA
jgi:hypothetical protein